MLKAIKKEKKFDPTLFISSFQDILTDGNLFIPGFVNTIKNNEVVDIRTLKPETGGLSKQAYMDFQEQKCVRSNDPLHSFFIYGKDASQIVAKTFDNKSTFGENSVFGYLHQNKGKLIIIDLDLYYGFTFAHYAEQCLKVPYRFFDSLNITYTNLNGDTSFEKFTVYAKRKGFIPNLNGLELPLLESEAMRKLTLNGLNFYIIQLDKAFDVIEEDVKRNKSQNIISFNFGLYLKQTLKQIAR